MGRHAGQLADDEGGTRTAGEAGARAVAGGAAQRHRKRQARCARGGRSGPPVRKTVGAALAEASRSAPNAVARGAAAESAGRALVVQQAAQVLQLNAAAVEVAGASSAEPRGRALLADAAGSPETGPAGPGMIKDGKASAGMLACADAATWFWTCTCKGRWPFTCTCSPACERMCLCPCGGAVRRCEATSVPKGEPDAATCGTLPWSMRSWLVPHRFMPAAAIPCKGRASDSSTSQVKRQTLIILQV